MKSGELALAPAPLSVRIQNVPSAMCLMPEWPCSGWPLKGSDTPVGRALESPSTLPACPTRLAVVYLPLICRSAGASLGDATYDCAGSTAWPLNWAGKACWAWAESATVAPARAIQTAAMGETANMMKEDSSIEKSVTMPFPYDTRMNQREFLAMTYGSDVYPP